jgi:hypothetical protein
MNPVLQTLSAHLVFVQLLPVATNVHQQAQHVILPAETVRHVLM